jgi:hypothetical protein
MRYSIAFTAALAASVQAHGVITAVQGANGVTMPGLSGKLFSPKVSVGVLSLLTLYFSQSPMVLLVILVTPSLAQRPTLPSSAPRRWAARLLLLDAPRLVL